MKGFGPLGLQFAGFGELEVVLGESLGEQDFDIGLFAVAGHGQFANQQVTGALEHFLFAEGKALGFFQDQKVLHDRRDLEQRSGTHAIGIVFEAVFPVGGVVTFAVGKKSQDLLDITVLHHSPQSHGYHAVEGHRHFEIAGLNIKEVVLLDLLTKGAGADLFDNSYAVVGIDDAVTNVEITVTVAAHTWNRPPRRETLLFYPTGRRLTICKTCERVFSKT